MNVPATSSYSAVYPSLSLPPPAAVSKTEGALTTSDRADIAQKTAQAYAQGAEFYTSKINECASVYNSLSEEVIQNSVADARAKYGDAFADNRQAVLENARNAMARGMGSDFTSNFVRNYIPETQYLSYAINPDQLFDLTV